jgi:NAD(P)H-flavin reductase/ferredoxin
VSNKAAGNNGVADKPQALVTFENETIVLAEGESLLEGLTRTGHSIPSGCRVGVCQACVVVMSDGEPSSVCQKGLSAPQKALSYVLSCQCKPDRPVTISRLSAASQQTQGRILAKDWLNESVLRLRVEADLDYHAGQYVTLWQGEELARSYSLASVPGEDHFLEFHIKYVPDGAFSPALCNKLKVGDTIGLQGPLGQCFYTARPDQPLLLVGIGVGLAPLMGILKDALYKEHSGPITLIVGAAKASNFYLQQALVDLAKNYEQLTLQFIAQSADRAIAPFNSSTALKGDLYSFCRNNYPDLKGYRVFLCGAESFVTKMRKQCFLSGAGMSDISADAFISFH